MTHILHGCNVVEGRTVHMVHMVHMGHMGRMGRCALDTQCVCSVQRLDHAPYMACAIASCHPPLFWQFCVWGGCGQGTLVMLPHLRLVLVLVH